MNTEEVKKVLERAGVIIYNTHVTLTSGRHSNTYLLKDALYPHTGTLSDLCREMAAPFQNSNVAAVLAPAVGGIPLAQWTAHHLSKLCGRDIYAVYAEKEIHPIADPENRGRKCYAETGAFHIGRQYDRIIADQRVLIVEDILTTGGTAKKVVMAARAIGCEVVGISALCNRGGVTPEQVAGVPKIHELVTLRLSSWGQEDCPLCKEGVPVNTTIGKGV